MAQLSSLRVDFEHAKQLNVEKSMILERSLESQREDYERRIEEMDRRNTHMRVEHERLRSVLAAERERAAALTPRECRERVEEYIDLTGRGASLASRCAAELRKKELALKACVRFYEEARVVSNPHR